MKPASVIALSFSLYGLALNPAAQAGMLNNETGLAHLVPAFQTETFDEVTVPFFTPVGNLFPDITFGGDAYILNGIQFGPHLSGNVVNTLAYNNEFEPVSILKFNAPKSAAAFVFVTPFATSASFTAMLGKNVVESFTAATNPGDTPLNFYGFKDIVFDSIIVNSGPYSEAVIDNVETAAVVPEPQTAAMLLAGLGGLGLLAATRQRKRRVQHGRIKNSFWRFCRAPRSPASTQPNHNTCEILPPSRH